MNKLKTLSLPKQVIAIAACLFVFALVPSPAYAAGLEVPKTPATFDCQGEECVKNNPMLAWIQFGINLLTVVIVAGSAVMIALAGVQYIASRDNASAVQEAKKKIFNVISALIAYFFLYGLVQWLIPGGVF